MDQNGVYYKMRDTKKKLAQLEAQLADLALAIKCKSILGKDFLSTIFCAPVFSFESFADQFIGKARRNPLLILEELLVPEMIRSRFIAVAVVRTGHFQKIKFSKVFKSGTPSELSYLA